MMKFGIHGQPTNENYVYKDFSYKLKNWIKLIFWVIYKGLNGMRIKVSI